MTLQKILNAALTVALMLGLAACGTTRDLTTAGIPGADPIMGDWEGYRTTTSGTVLPLAVQLVSYGSDTYEATVYEAFGMRDPDRFVIPLRKDGDAFSTSSDPGFRATLKDGVITGISPRANLANFTLRRVQRTSPTLGAQPPAGAVVLFDGRDLAQWKVAGKEERPAAWKLVDGAMEVAPNGGTIVTKKPFGDCDLHLEFRTPFMPTKRGQERGNSGVYMQGRYEIQVLDSYGLTGEDNECGGIYKVAQPRVNMCAPPGQWQTYDISFRAPRFDANGNKTASAMVTVRHNGVIIHQNLAIPGPTGGALDERVSEPGGLCLQDHGNPVQYRNIWLVEPANGR
jgi:hypothetical protein